MTAANELLERIKPYKAPRGAAKRDTKDPCKLCGWSKHEAIHQQPHLHGRGPYHEHVSNEP